MREGRPLIGTVIDGQRLTEAHVLGGGREEAPELEILHPQTPPEGREGEGEEPPVQRGGYGVVRERKDERGVDPEIVGHLLRALQEARELAADLAEIPAAGEVRPPGADGVQPQHAVVPGERPHDVVAARRVLGPVLREANDVFARHDWLTVLSGRFLPSGGGTHALAGWPYIKQLPPSLFTPGRESSP